MRYNRKLSEKLKNDINHVKILVVRAACLVIDRNNILHVLINNLKTAGRTEIVMPLVSFSDNLL